MIMWKIISKTTATPMKAQKTCIFSFMNWKWTIHVDIKYEHGCEKKHKAQKQEEEEKYFMKAQQHCDVAYDEPQKLTTKI